MEKQFNCQRESMLYNFQKESLIILFGAPNKVLAESKTIYITISYGVTITLVCEHGTFRPCINCHYSIEWNTSR